MNAERMVQQAARINFEILAHGVQPRVGFEWRETLIHDPFSDPQYGAFSVDPAAQYGDAYTASVFATDPAAALEAARGHLRNAAREDIGRYRMEGKLAAADVSAAIEAAGARAVAESGDPLEGLADDQVARVWSELERLATAPATR